MDPDVYDPDPRPPESGTGRPLSRKPSDPHGSPPFRTLRARGQPMRIAETPPWSALFTMILQMSVPDWRQARAPGLFLGRRRDYSDIRFPGNHRRDPAGQSRIFTAISV